MTKHNFLNKRKFIAISFIVICTGLTGCTNIELKKTDSVQFNKSSTIKNIDKETVEKTQPDTEIATLVTELVLDERPEYKAMEYVKFNDYSNIDISDIEKESITQIDVKQAVLDDMIKHGIDTDSSLTNELVSILSNQNCQSVSDYNAYIEKELDLINKWTRIGKIYDRYKNTALAELNIPEEVFTYDMYDTSKGSPLYTIARQYGYTVDELCSRMENNVQFKENIEAFINNMIIDEMTAKAFAEKENIEVSESDYESMYEIMRIYYDKTSVQEMMDEYGEKSIKKEAFKLKVAEAISELSVLS